MITNRINIKHIIIGFFFLSLASLAQAEVLPVDSDADGSLDQWHHKSEEGVLLKVEHDKNGDGKIDQIDVFEGNEKPSGEQEIIDRKRYDAVPKSRDFDFVIHGGFSHDSFNVCPAVPGLYSGTMF